MTKREDLVLKQLHEQCIIDCDALLQRPALLDTYPHRYVFLRVLGMRKLFPRLFSAVELLEARGWTAVHWDLSTGAVTGALMHRPAD